MPYADLVTGDIRYELDECSCGHTPEMIVFDCASGGCLYGVKCEHCGEHTPTLYPSAKTAEIVWHNIVKEG